MLKHISWLSFSLFIAILLLLYYGIVVPVFYKDELKEFLKRKKPLGEKGDTDPAQNTDTKQRDLFGEVRLQENELDKSIEAKLYDEAKALANEIKVIVQKRYIKEELITALQGKVSKYPELKGTGFQPAITNFIAAECEKGPVRLSAEELSVVWIK